MDSAANALTTRKVLLFGLVLGIFVFSLWILFPGKLECSADGPTHAFGVWFYQYALETYHKVPWTNTHQYGGSMFASVYFSIFYVLGGLVSLFFNYTIAIKLVIAALYLLAAFSVYLLAKEYGLGREMCILAGVLYAFSNWQMFSTFFRGAYLDLPVYALFPLPLLFMKRGLERNLTPFIASLVLLLASNQISASFFLPAIFIYGAASKKITPKQFFLSALVLALSMAFFFVPFAKLRTEVYFFQDLSLKMAPAVPSSLILPQWGLRYDLYERFFIHWGSLDSTYLGLMRSLLAVIGMAAFWRKFPELTILSVLSIGVISGVIPSSTFPARVLLVLNVPLALFAAMGLDRFLKKSRPKLVLPVLGCIALLGLAGLLVMVHVYSLRAGIAVSLATIAAVLAVCWIVFVLFLLKKSGNRMLVLAVLFLLALDVLPNAVNPTMIFPTRQQIDTCSYADRPHEFVTNAFCAPQGCDNVYIYQIGNLHLGSKLLMGRFLEAVQGCKSALSELGIKYCFDGTKMRELDNPAPFVKSTSSYSVEKDEPDNVVIRFERAGNTTVALGYFEEYAIAGDGGKAIQFWPDENGFISLANPAGTVSIRFSAPMFFVYSYLLSFFSLLALAVLLVPERRKTENAIMLFGLAVLLFHIGMRLAAMLFF